MQIKEEGLNIHMCLCRESFGVNTAYGVYLEEENALFESHAIYLHTYRQKGKGQIILDVKGHISIPVIQHMQRQEYFLFLYRCFIMQRQYDWFCLSDKVQAAVECLLPFIRENHMTCYGLLGEQGGAVEAPNILYNRFSGCMFTMFHKEKMGWTWKQDWLLGGGLNLWGIQDDVLKIFVLHMQSEEESIQRMILFGNIMKDIFSEEGEALFQNRIVNPNPPDIWHGWEEIKKVKANFVSLSPLYQMPGNCWRQ